MIGRHLIIATNFMVSSEVPLCDAMKKAKMSDDVISIEYYFLQVLKRKDTND